MRKHISIGFIIFLAVAALQGQSKEELQNQKQKAFDDIKLARELMEKTSRKRVGSVQQLRIGMISVDNCIVRGFHSSDQYITINFITQI